MIDCPGAPLEQTNPHPDIDGESNITPDEVQANHADIASYALARLSVLADGTPCTLHSPGHVIARRSDGDYAALKIDADCKPKASALQPSAPRRSDAINIHYSLFFDLDAEHKVLLRLVSGERAATNTVAGVFAASKPQQRFDLRKPPLLPQLLSFLVSRSGTMENQMPRRVQASTSKLSSPFSAALMIFRRRQAARNSSSIQSGMNTISASARCARASNSVRGNVAFDSFGITSAT